MQDSGKNAELRYFYECFFKHVEVFGYDREISDADSAANGYLKLGLSTLIALNGGALVALPAVFSSSYFLNSTALWTSAAFFVIGLILCCIGMLAAALASFYKAKSIHNRKFLDYTEMKDQMIPQSGECDKSSSDFYSDQHSKTEKLSLVAKMITAVVLPVSLAMFIMGAFSLLSSAVKAQEDAFKVSVVGDMENVTPPSIPAPSQSPPAAQTPLRP